MVAGSFGECKNLFQSSGMRIVLRGWYIENSLPLEIETGKKDCGRMMSPMGKLNARSSVLFSDEFLPSDR